MIVIGIVWDDEIKIIVISGEPAVAAKSLEEMLRLNFDLRTLAQLVLAYAKFDLNKVFDKIIECYLNFTT